MIESAVLHEAEPIQEMTDKPLGDSESERDHFGVSSTTFFTMSRMISALNET